MKRWHLTAGLAGSALAAALLAPRLVALLGAPQAPTPPDITAEPVIEAEPIVPVASQGVLRVSAQMDNQAVEQNGSTERFVTIELTAPSAEGDATRRAVDLAVVMDTSGSMAAAGKIDYAKRAAKYLARSLQPGDTFSLITFDDDATTVIPAGQVHNLAAVERAIDSIYEGGGTNLYGGMSQGAQQLRPLLTNNGIDRVVVLSDGHANVGITEPDALGSLAASLSSDGITVSTIGLGLDFNEDTLASLADQGGGSYAFVDSPTDLEEAFRAELTETASVATRQTELTLSLEPGVQLVELIGWTATQTTDGWRVYVGDVYAGQTKRVTAKVKVNAGSAPQMPIASATARYVDVGAQRADESSGSVQARITNDPAELAASVNKEASATAARAYGTWYLDMATRAYEKGDRSKSQRMLKQGRAVLEEANEQYPSPDLKNQIEVLDEVEQVHEMHTPSSSAGRRAIKATKENVRLYTR